MPSNENGTSPKEYSLENYLINNYQILGDLQLNECGDFEPFPQSYCKQYSSNIKYVHVIQNGGEIWEICFPRMRPEVAEELIRGIFPIPELVQISETSFFAEGYIFWLEIEHTERYTIVRHYSGC